MKTVGIKAHPHIACTAFISLANIVIAVAHTSNHNNRHVSSRNPESQKKEMQPKRHRNAKALTQTQHHALIYHKTRSRV
ncbi:hypothetical protein BR93DRAFT_568983 [Coniochaeta sp. PMI_546]|nr:hypothetical protein BR93DRAFT_568983 [Coniochaeta sp. PMI_546]